MIRRLWRAVRGQARPARAAARDDELRQQVRAAAKEITNLRKRLQQVERGFEQVRAAQAAADDPRIEARLAALDVARAEQHVRAAVLRSERRVTPVLETIVADVWPEELLAAIRDTMPGPVFFQRDSDTREHLVLPPRLAPVPALIVWTFATDLLTRVLGPALAGQFEPDVPEARRLQTSPGVLVRRYAGDPGAPVVHRPGHVLTGTIDLDTNQASVTAGGAGPGHRSAGRDAGLAWAFAFYPGE